MNRVGEVWELSYRASNGKLSLLYLVVRTDEPVHYLLCLEEPREAKVFELSLRESREGMAYYWERVL